MSKLHTITKTKKMPAPRYGYGYWSNMAKKMTEGSSVLVTNRKESASLLMATKRIGGSVETRKEGPYIRVWRIS